MTDNKVHPFTELRRAIRQAGRQFRKNNDNSASIFHPVGGFEYAYDISAVEDALDLYETSLGTEYEEAKPKLTVEEQILIRGKRLSESHDSMEVRDFARFVLAHMARLEKASETSPELQEVLQRFE